MKTLFTVLSMLFVVGGLLGMLGADQTSISAIVLVCIGMAGIGIAAYNKRK